MRTRPPTWRSSAPRPTSASGPTWRVPSTSRTTKGADSFSDRSHHHDLTFLRFCRQIVSAVMRRAWALVALFCTLGAAQAARAQTTVAVLGLEPQDQTESLAREFTDALRQRAAATRGFT